MIRFFEADRIREGRCAMDAEAKVISISELSEYLRVHRSTLYRLLKKGQLPGFRVGSDWRFNVEAIDRWCRQQPRRLVRSAERPRTYIERRSNLLLEYFRL
jgi:excisionase family DNA binding protein